MALDAKAILFTSPGQVASGDVQVPEPKEGQLLVDAIVTLISPGTELRCLAGKQPNTNHWPFVPGYAHVGRVVQSLDPSVPEGTVVMSGGSCEILGAAKMWGGHVSRATVNAREAYVVPDGVDPVSAIVARLAAIANRGPIVAQAQAGETVAVIGLGAIGQLSARIFKQLGCEVAAFDTEPARVELARKGGVEAYVVEGSLGQTVRKKFPSGAAIVSDATGAPSLLDQSIACGFDKPWGDSGKLGVRVVLQGSYPGDFAADYQKTFEKEASILFPRDSHPSDLRHCLQLIAAGAISVRELVGDVVSPHDAPNAYARLQGADRSVATIAFDWSLA